MTLSFFGVEAWQEEPLRAAFPETTLRFFAEDFSAQFLDVVHDAEILSGTIYSAVTREFIDRLPKLRCITTRSTGYDHIDFVAAKEKGIIVCNVPTYGEHTVAEHTFALILALSRRIPESVERTKKGDFSLVGLRGVDLVGKTLGVIGIGHIGQHVIRMARGFGMKVLGFSRNQDEKLASSLGFTFVDFPTVLRESDILTLHIPGGKETHHMMDANAFSRMKKGAILINTARGEVVDTEALVRALESSQLAGAGLDVLEEECYIKEEAQLLSPQFPKECDLKTILHNHMLVRRPNVIITPHNAFNSEEAVRRILQTTIENIQAFIAGHPQNVVQ
ncbi:MAG: hydroxyacid dehydrogenase [bacterium]|nr:hydroxyacid dehydrogenase [bacterium]